MQREKPYNTFINMKTLVEKINEDMKLAMKAQDKETLSVVRMIKSAVQLAKIELKHELSDEEVVDVVVSKGYSVSNIDCTIAMQRPKLRPYIDTMRERIAEVVGVDVDRVSVKATTTERLGFEGREEGVSANAVVLLIKA